MDDDIAKRTVELLLPFHSLLSGSSFSVIVGIPVCVNLLFEWMKM